MAGPDAQLSRDLELAKRHGVVFSAVGRPDGQSPRDGSPRRFGEFDDPAEAIRVAASIDGHSVTVVADGHGAYWHSDEPEVVNSELLARVCRFKALSPEEAERERLREERHFQRERLLAESRLAEAIDLTTGCRDVAHAQQCLERADPPFSTSQAKYLLSSLRLRRLTIAGKAELQRQLDGLTAVEDEPR